MNKKLYIVVLFCFLLIQSYGTEYYCNPLTGSMSNSGISESQPWGTLEAVFSANKTFSPGDIIYLMTGYHGSPTIKGTNSDYVTIQPLQGQAPTLKNVTFSAAKKWKLYGLTISPETAPTYSRVRLVDISSSSTDNIIDNCFMYSVSDNSRWTTESDWTTNCCSGLRIQGADNTVRNSKFLNIWNAVIVAKGANRCLFEKNIIENYMEDAMRGLADNCIFQYNTVKNSYGIGTYHEDGFQSWSVGADGQIASGVVYGIVLRGNTFIDFTNVNQPFKRTSNNHAIGIYDGMAENWIVENNIVVFNGFNGIVIQGATNCKIVNNTVIKNPVNVSEQIPYISIENHDNGTLSSGNIVRNNLASSYYRLYGCVADHNITTIDYDSYFVDHVNYDLHLKPQAQAIDQGTPDDAPSVDIVGNSRPFGNGYDVGAYESLISPPGITTSIATSISASSAVLGGNVSDSNGASVTERGIVYSTTNSPTIDVPGVTKISSGAGTGVFSESIGTLSPVTTYYVQAYAINSAGTSYGGVQSFTTSKSDQTITFDPLSVKTYGDVDFNLSATASSGLTVSYTTSDPNIAVIVGDLVHIVGTGTCTIFIDQAGNETYNAAAQASQTLTVNKAELIVTADAQTKVYGEANPVLTYQYSGWKNGDNVSVLTVTPTISTTVTQTTSVGTYPEAITVSGGAAGNYTFTYVPADFNVTAATITITADAQTKVYGDVNPVLTYQYSGWKNGEDASVLTTTPTISTTVTTTTSVGTYTDAITVSGGATENYMFSYVPANFNIIAATITVTADAQTKVYGDVNPVLTYQYSGWKNGEDASVLTTTPTISTTVTTTTSVDTYTDAITVSGGAAGNYTFTYVPADFNVTAATLTVTSDAQTKVYGDVNLELTYQYSGWKNGEDASVLTTTPTISTTVTTTTSVGTYTDAITVSGGAAGNYTFMYVPADFNVTAATLTITADAKIKVYGEANPVLTYQYSGWKNGENASVLTVTPTISTTVTQTTSVGTYPDAIIVSGGAAANYTFTYVPASFTVTKATVIVWLDNKVKEYGQDNPVLTYRYTGFMNGDDESVLESKPYPATIVTKFSDAGVYPNSITLVGGRDDKYLILSVPATFTVTKAKQQITFDELTPKTYGDAPFSLLATSTSGATLTFTCSNPNVADVSGNTVNITGTGTATIVVSQSGTLNFEGATATQTLTVTPKVINVTAQSVTVECNQVDQELRYTFEPTLIVGDSFKGELARTPGSTSGVYPISQGTLTLGNNYRIVFNGADYTVVNTKNLPPVVDFVADQKAFKNSKEAIVTLTGIDPVSNCTAQEIESITAEAENKTLIPDIQVEYTKGESSAYLKVKITDEQTGETKISVKLKDNGGTQDEGIDTREITFIFKVEIPTGIDDLNQNTNVVIYPNPSDGIVNIKYSGFNDPAIRVFKVTGEEMVKFTKLSTLTLPFNLSGYGAGVYFVEISENKNIVVKKLIIN